jgi:hypothetical protein
VRVDSEDPLAGVAGESVRVDSEDLLAGVPGESMRVDSKDPLIRGPGVVGVSKSSQTTLGV